MFEEYNSWNVLLDVSTTILLPLAVVITILSIISYRILKKLQHDKMASSMSLIVTFGILGGVLGVFIGASKTPAIGTYLPALLTFITSITAYIFGKDNQSDFKTAMPFCLILLLVVSLYGSFIGTDIRSDASYRNNLAERRIQEIDRRYAEWLAEYQMNLESQKTMNNRIIQLSDMEGLNGIRFSFSPPPVNPYLDK